ncbi:MAG: acyl-CoA dehydrogenase family protein [Deltaproteobacteria bacterium]|nr:MAG: acyl-CoA dehydrogenase family protein [Deltaproteobacteria bacterium]
MKPRPPVTELSEEEQIFRDSVREFAEEVVRPRVAEMEADRKQPADLLAKLFEMGLMGIEIPEAYGGAGASFFMSILAIEELSRVDPALAIPVDVQNTLVINQFLKYGSEDQKQRYLPRIARDTVSSYALSEAGSGSDAFALACAAVPDGDDYRLSGRKLWISNAAEAGIFIVFANADPAAGYRGITAFIVERDMPGFQVGRKEDKLGVRASSTCELILEDVRVPRANVLGAVGQGYKIAIQTLNEGRIGIGAQMLGLARGALEGALAYSKERKAFGQPIGEFQAVQHLLAECATDIETVRLHVYNAARLRELGRSCLREGAMAKLVASRVAESVASRALDVYGGLGVTSECPAEKYLRDAKVAQIYEGTTFMQLNTIAKSLQKDGL